jgi:Domain of unknown function (DUF3387)
MLAIVLRLMPGTAAFYLAKPAFGSSSVLWTVFRAVKVLGDETLRTVVRELVATVRRNVTIVRAQLRVLVKRILRKYGYPPDKQEKATQTVLEQAEALSAGWAT